MGFRLTDVVGVAFAEGTPLRVTAKNTAVYAANVMAADAGAKSLGDGDPDFMLQPGAQLVSAGAPVTNAHNVPYTPVTVPGRDGPYFVRSTSIAPAAAAASTLVPMASVASAPSAPWWVWLLLVLGGGAVAVGGYKLATGKKRS